MARRPSGKAQMQFDQYDVLRMHLLGKKRLLGLTEAEEAKLSELAIKCNEYWDKYFPARRATN